MYLDKSRIPAEKMDDSRLNELEQWALKKMQNPTYRLYVCLHEAAHAVYSERAGAKRIIFHGPVAFYDSAKDAFQIGAAGVEPDFGNVRIEVDVSSMARWYVAGAAAQRNLVGDFPDFQVDSDWRDLEIFTSEMVKHFPLVTQKNILEIWEVAKKDVERDLRSPAFRKILWQRARELEAWLLGPSENADNNRL